MHVLQARENIGPTAKTKNWSIVGLAFFFFFFFFVVVVVVFLQCDNDGLVFIDCFVNVNPAFSAL